MSEANRKTGRPALWGKWVDHNKGDQEEPNVRSRYVACEVATYRDDSMFAATPPLEGFRLLLSHAAASQGGSTPAKVLLMDVRKAHLHATPVREVYVQLPPELKARHPGQCWLLRRCLYGTRDAPARWEALYTERFGPCVSNLDERAAAASSIHSGSFVPWCTVTTSHSQEPIVTSTGCNNKWRKPSCAKWKAG